MKVRCDNCNTAFSVDDSKIINKRFAFNCPSCKHHNIFDNRPLAESSHETDDFFNEPVQSAAAERNAGPKKAPVDTPDFEESSDSILLDDFDSDIKAVSGKAKKHDDALIDDDSFDLDIPVFEPKKSAADTGKAYTIDALEDEALFDDEIMASPEPLRDSRGPAKSVEADTDPILDPTKDDNDLFLRELSSLEEEMNKELPAQAHGGKAEKRDDFDLDEIDDLDDFAPVEIDHAGHRAGHDKHGAAASRLAGASTEPKRGKPINKELLTETTDADESITIDLNSLDIQLVEDEETPQPKKDKDIAAYDFADLTDSEIAAIQSRSLAERADDMDEDESITIDLASLDIPLEEEDEIKSGIAVEDDEEEDERLTLEDAGLTMDELVEEKPKTAQSRQARYEAAMDDSDEDDDIKLSIDEIDPTLSVDRLVKQDKKSMVAAKPEDDFLYEDLPEVDLDKYDEEFVPSNFANKGIINFSIDYSLKFSRLGAALRLLMLFGVRLLPHFIVLMLYYMLSMIVGAFNGLSVLFTGESVDDFLSIQKNTIRYLLSLEACMSNVIEDVPRYAGVTDIDYALQYTVIQPSKFSRLLAFLRLTGIGMLVIMLPHLVILALLSLGTIVIVFVGLVSILITTRWPNVLFDFMIRYFRYLAHVLSYLFGVIDKYPNFRFD